MSSPFLKTISIACTLGLLLLIVGCQGMQTRFGTRPDDYSQAKEMPPLKFPSDTLAVSKRYDIPSIPDNNKPIINDIVPPDF